jgi:hypothetical protein
MPNLTLLVEGRLFAQEEILCRQGGSKSDETAQKSDYVQAEVVKCQPSMGEDFVAWVQSSTAAL